jgi:hypothetical protein
MASEEEIEALQKAYNSICTALTELGRAGWIESPLTIELEDIREKLAAVAFE